MLWDLVFRGTGIDRDYPTGRPAAAASRMGRSSGAVETHLPESRAKTSALLRSWETRRRPSGIARREQRRLVRREPAARRQNVREAFAHTSPFYVLVDGQPIRSPEDARYFHDYSSAFMKRSLLRVRDEHIKGLTDEVALPD